MIVECAGLPGGGKTTICRQVEVPHGGKGAVALPALRVDRALLRAAWHILALCFGARPFRLNRLKRGFNLVVFLRHYQHPGKVLLLDQGQVQKLWSILADAEVYSAARLKRVLASLTAFAPGHVVWVDTPLDMAVQRMAARGGGNSRYDGLPPDEVTAQLMIRSALLRTIAGDYCRVTGAPLTTLDGRLPPDRNAARIAELLQVSG